MSNSITRENIVATIEHLIDKGIIKNYKAVVDMTGSSQSYVSTLMNQHEGRTPGRNFVDRFIAGAARKGIDLDKAILAMDGIGAPPPPDVGPINPVVYWDNRGFFVVKGVIRIYPEEN